jgi:hypothetical protein
MDFNITQCHRNKALEMLKHEQVLRYSKKYQDMYDQGFNRYGNPEFIERCIQRETLNNFEFTDNDKSLYNYQMIGQYYQNDEEIKNAIHYLRINIIKDCPLKVMDNYRDSDLLTLDKKNCKLSELLIHDKPNVIFAGSIT